jgi:hypothetical protein
VHAHAHAHCANLACELPQNENTDIQTKTKTRNLTETHKNTSYGVYDELKHGFHLPGQKQLQFTHELSLTGKDDGFPIIIVQQLTCTEGIFVWLKFWLHQQFTEKIKTVEMSLDAVNYYRNHTSHQTLTKMLYSIYFKN